MADKIIKSLFSAVGVLTGYTITQTLLSEYLKNRSANVQVVATAMFVFLCGLLFYVGFSGILSSIKNFLDLAEQLIQKLTMIDIMLASISLVISLVIANLLTIPVARIDVIGLPVSIFCNVFFGVLGIYIVLNKKHDLSLDFFRTGKNTTTNSIQGCRPKVLDTSVIIDGRILDIIRTGVLEGELVVPSFVLDELRHIADSQDAIKRNKGRRGLDVLNGIQKELGIKIRIENYQLPENSEVDSEIVRFAQKINAKVVTTDFNLNKVASFLGVNVININELTNALKPLALPGEEMCVHILKDGKENGQGVAYLDDGTMIVVDGGKKYMGEQVYVQVTSVFQTPAGRMIFAKPKIASHRAVQV